MCVIVKQSTQVIDNQLFISNQFSTKCAFPCAKSVRKKQALPIGMDMFPEYF